MKWEYQIMEMDIEAIERVIEFRVRKDWLVTCWI